MPRKDGTDSDGKEPKNVKQGTPTPKRDDSCGCNDRRGCENKPCDDR